MLRREYGLEAGEAAIGRSPAGRVNETYFVDFGRKCVLQKLNGFLAALPGLGENLNRVRQAMIGTEVNCPAVIPAKNGDWHHVDPKDGSVWRLLDFLPGRPPEKNSLDDAFVSAKALGKCHEALNSPRPIDLTPTHMDNGEFSNQKLCQARDFEVISQFYRGHPRLSSLDAELKRGVQAANWLPNRPAFQKVFLARDLVIHLDCKRDNFLLDPFAGPSLIDWDTVGYGDPLLDVGEMCRSWAVAEEKPFFEAKMAAALIQGYREGGFRLEKERFQLLPTVVRAMALNLARRYLTDALAEVYFQWDREAYPSLYEQNKARARHLLDLTEELLDREAELSRI
ncbi:MAG: phosphotransferase [Deltaproteobacteria bacterium]|nr:phosphotransferase [Deltaproteobacteria bacterium]